MIYLVLSIFCASLIIHSLKAAQRFSVSSDLVLFINYLLAAAGALLIALVPDHAAAQNLTPTTLQNGLGQFWYKDPLFLLIGIFTGGLFIGNFYLLNWSIKRLGPGPSGAASRISAVLPVVASVAFFGDPLGPWQLAGFFLALVALPLSVPKGIAGALLSLSSFSKVLPALSVFFTFGFSDFTLKVQTELFPPESKTWYLVIIFCTALTLSLCRVVYESITKPKLVSSRLNKNLNPTEQNSPLLSQQNLKSQPTFKSNSKLLITLGLGLLLGLSNYFATLFFSLTLDQVEGSIAYTLNSLGIILTVSLSSVWLWKENLDRRSWIFLGLACLVIILVNLP